jgi:hypothetical protein
MVPPRDLLVFTMCLELSTQCDGSMDVSDTDQNRSRTGCWPVKRSPRLGRAK